jgi:hypothetical protein
MAEWFSPSEEAIEIRAMPDLEGRARRLVQMLQDVQGRDGSFSHQQTETFFEALGYPKSPAQENAKVTKRVCRALLAEPAFQHLSLKTAIADIFFCANPVLSQLSKIH